MGQISNWFLVTLIITTLVCDIVTSSRILLLPVNHGSHVNFFASVGQTLKNAGHDVYALTGPRHAKVAAGYGINQISVNVTNDINIIEEMIIKQHANMFQIATTFIPMLKGYIRDIFADTVLMTKLQSLKFDLAIIDSFDFIRHLYLLPYKLSIPYITLAVRPDPWTSRVSALPSVEGFFPTMSMSEDSTILHRALNTMTYFVSMLFLPQSYLSPINDDSMFHDLVPEKENVGLNELYLRSEMILVNLDVICLETPRVSSPYYQHVGGIAAKPAKPLPEDMEKFASSAKHGVIVMTFGSGVPTIPDEMLEKMIYAFSHIKQHVFIRHGGEVPKNMPKNVFLSKWLPQNDLLGHPNTKLFITHSGNNGQLEAVYHGVPMLSVPLFGDQPYNAWRVEVKGYGKTLDPNDFTGQQLEEMIIELTENEAYYNKIQKCSKILRDLPSAQETILFWVEHILKFGGSHLRPYYLRMPIWKYLLFDVMLLFMVIFISSACLLRFCCIRCCCKRKPHQKVD